MHETLCALIIAATTMAAQSSCPSDWSGVWQGELDGQPSIVLTLAQDNGALGGTLVFNIINRDGGQPRIIAHEPHTIMQPRLDDARFSFQLKRIDASASPMNFSVELTSADRAKIHCHNCGENAPTVEMTKQD